MDLEGVGSQHCPTLLQAVVTLEAEELSEVPGGHRDKAFKRLHTAATCGHEPFETKALSHHSKNMVMKT